MISIIIPVFNQAVKLKQCLDNVMTQTYTDWEIIIVDDGSTDNSLDTATKKQRSLGARLKVISQKNSGANSARNAGAKLALGEFLIFCDADIIMASNMLEAMLSTLENKAEASYAYSSFRYGKKLFKLWPFDAVRLKNTPYIHTTSLIRRNHFAGFDEKIKRLQDWDLWLTMLEAGHIGHWIDQVLFTVQTGGTMSQWLPRAAYKYLPFLSAVKKYRSAEAIIKKKHGL